ncbi:MAG: class I tRNA ligase family protein, partial [Coriobacteriales bacterium]|nr:class I tRNA ligase family protein [Coriobacteriales bacterium]
LLYSRFFTKVLRDIGLVDFNEPFTNLLCQGRVLDGKGEVMSKSKGNVIAPEDMIAQYGADAVRAYILFMAPPDKELLWNEAGLAGMFRFLKRVWRQVQLLSHDPDVRQDNVTEDDAKGKAAAKTLNRELHRVIGKVTDDIERFNFNTALAAIMELANATDEYLKYVPAQTRANCEPLQELDAFAAKTLVLLLAPFAPHWAEELWHEVLGEQGSVHLQDWPTWDPAQAVAETVTYPVQINGKVRARVELSKEAGKDELQAAALEAAASYLDGKTPKKVVVAPGRLVSIVI